MKTIVFATNNAHKLEEVRDIVSSNGLTVTSLPEIGCHDDIPETKGTLDGNALQKAEYVKKNFGYDCFADDTGLEVEALGGAPGVYSARYAGEQHDSNANMDKLLAALKGETNRKARFRTVIALILNGRDMFFEGVVNGRIIDEKRGDKGFGYDPVFVPDGYDKTFAELGEDVKNEISHRAIATKKLAAYLKTIAFALLSLMLPPLTSNAQSDSDWTAYLAYSEATEVEETNSKVFVLASGSLFSYGKEDSEIRAYSRQNGLNDTDISTIRYDSDTHTLAIIYDNGNIDLFNEDGITNLPYLKNASNVQSKNVNDVYFYNGYAYLATDFGIMAINLKKQEIADTYKLDKAVSSVCIMGETIYAATLEGLFRASTNDNLLDASVWEKVPLDNSGINETAIGKLCAYKGELCMLVENAGLFYLDSDGSVKAMLSHTYMKGVTPQSDGLLAYTHDNLYVFSGLDAFTYVSNISGTINDVSSKTDGTYWIATEKNGLAGMRQTSSSQFETFASGITVSNSPKRKYNAFMTMHNGEKLLIAGGGRMNNRYNLPGTLMVYEDGTWTNFDEDAANEEIYKLILSWSYDYVGVAVDPDDDNHYYVATYGEGIIEIKDNKFVNLHNQSNSPLVSALSDNSPNYVRVGSVCFDSNKNLWAINCLAKNQINVLKADGTWASLYYQELNGKDKTDKILITSKGHKWINVPYDDAGIFVLDDNGTIDDTSDDTYNFFQSFLDANSSVGASISPSQFLCMAEDKDGTIWLGTNIGLLKISSPSRAIDNPSQLSCSRPIRDDAYFLSGESVTALAVDSDNQKWIGTNSSGVYLINADGSETIYNFTTDNSPLLSNTIQSIAVNDATGEVFFGTDKGLISFNSGVTSGGKSFSDVYAYPNPVRPDYEGKVTITGLTNNTNVKITDINGNLIYQGKSTGSQLTWNCRNAGGNRVASGVYLVFAATEGADESVVTKIAVVK